MPTSAKVRGRVFGMCAILLVVAAPPAMAQGALSIQGFGYPVGGQSARSLGVGTSIADVDPQSPFNPAAIVMNARAQGYFQYEPEFRSVNAGGKTASTRTSRFPLFMISGRQRSITLSLSFSSFMDRTWANSYADTQTVGAERIASTVLTQSEGGIADARFAAAYSLNEKVHFGIGLHAYPGRNRVSFGRAFADSAKAGAFELSDSYNFSGSALSLGTVLTPTTHLIISGDVRLGGSLRMRLGDSTVVGKGSIPFRAGVSATFDGIPGSVLSARVGMDQWTDMAGLGTASLGLRNATDMSVGAEVVGPRVGPSALLFRTGFRSRGLPFAYGTNAVREKAISGGLGLPVLAGRATMDLAVVRATRTAASVTEKAWVISLGVGIRPQ